MAINTDQLLNRSSGRLAMQKAQQEKMVGGASVNIVLTKKSIKNVDIIKTNVVKIESFFKGTLALDKKQLDDKKRATSRKRKDDIETKLETKPNAESGGKVKLPAAPRMGILDWIKNFIGNIILGYFVVRLIDHLPKIMPILKFLGGAADFIIDIGGKLLNGLVTFIDVGYKAYDATRGLVKNLFGKSGEKQFDQLSSVLNTFLNTVIIAGMLFAGSGGFGGGPRGGPKGGGPRGGPSAPGTRGTRTTSGGRPQGRPDIRNPLRQTPKVTTGGGGVAGGLDIRNPLRARPKVTVGGGGNKALLSSVRPFLKRIPLPVIGALIDFGLSIALGENVGKAAFRAIGAGLLGAVGAAVGSVVPIAGNIIGGIIGGTAGDMAGGALYDMFFTGKKPQQKGKVQGKAGGGITRGGKSAGGAKRSFGGMKKKETYKRRIAQKPSQVQIKPGADVGGEDKIFGIFPNPLKAAKKVIDTVNPFNIIKTTGEDLGKTDYFGPILAITSKMILGQQPDQMDYKNVGLGLNLLIAKGVQDGQLKGGIIPAFAEGGLVDPDVLSAVETGGDISSWVSNVFRGEIETGAQKTMRLIKENMAKKKAENDAPPSGDPHSGGGDGTGSTGGISGSGVDKAVSVSKKLIADLGITPAQASGIVGNFLYESAGMNPGEREGEPYGIPEKPPSLGTLGVGYGWAQWTNSAPGDRLDKFLKSYGGDKGKIATDDDNYRFLMQELKGSESLTRKGSVTGTFFPKDDPQAASDWFRQNWERAGVPADEKRRKQTLEVFNKIKGLSREQAKLDVEKSGGRIIVGDVGDMRNESAGSQSSKILAGAKKIIGKGSGVGDQCANTVRDALRVGGHPAANKRTKIGDLDTPKGTAFSAPAYAASFGGSDMGKIIRNRSSIKAGDIILWRDYAGGKYGKGAITHVGIAADDGLKNQYDHNKERGFHYRPHWDRGSGTEWFAGVRLMDSGGMITQLTPAILGEAGRPEGVVGGKITQLLEEMSPGTLPAIIGSRNKSDLRNILENIIPVEDIIIIPSPSAPEEDEYDSGMSGGGVAFMPIGGGDADPFSTLYQGG